MKETWLVKRGAAALIAILLAATVLACTTAVHAHGLLYAVLDGRRTRSMEAHEPSYFELREQMFAGQADTRVSGWLSLIYSEEVTIRSGRGNLAATHYPPVAAGDTRWALVQHGGLGTDRSQVADIACVLSLSGYHVLTPDLYAHGQSDGDISSLGLREAEDIESWIAWILAQHADAEIVLYGLDEGGIACLLAGRSMPHAVSAVAVDSIYKSVSDRMTQLAEEVHGGRSAIDRALMGAAFRLSCGPALKMGEMESAVQDYSLPLLVIHGTGDTDVPAWHGEDIALAAGEKASLYFAEGAGHGMARFLEPQKYSETLLGFYAGALGLGEK